MWRNTALKAELFPGCDGRVVIALFIWLLKLSMVTFTIFGTTCVFFWLIGRRGYTVPVTFLKMRSMIIGNVRTKWTAGEYCARTLPGDPAVQ